MDHICSPSSPRIYQFCAPGHSPLSALTELWREASGPNIPAPSAKASLKAPTFLPGLANGGWGKSNPSYSLWGRQYCNQQHFLSLLGNNSKDIQEKEGTLPLHAAGACDTCELCCSQADSQCTKAESYLAQSYVTCRQEKQGPHFI